MVMFVLASNECVMERSSFFSVYIRVKNAQVFEIRIHIHLHKEKRRLVFCHLISKNE
jgi:hypothetical protein